MFYRTLCLLTHSFLHQQYKPLTHSTLIIQTHFILNHVIVCKPNRLKIKLVPDQTPLDLSSTPFQSYSKPFLTTRNFLFLSGSFPSSLLFIVSSFSHVQTQHAIQNSRQFVQLNIYNQLKTTQINILLLFALFCLSEQFSFLVSRGCSHDTDKQSF